MRVRDVGHAGDVLNGAGREVDMRRGDERGAIVYGAGDRLDRHADGVRTLDDDELDSLLRLGEPLVGHGWKIERRDDHFGPPRVVERLSHGAQCHGNAGCERDLTRCRMNEPGVAGAQVGERVPPHVVPGGCAAALPDVEEFRYLAARTLAKRAQRAGVQVDRVPKDGKLAPITSESQRARGSAACKRHRPGIYRRSAAYRELVRAVRAFGAAGARESATRRGSLASRVELPGARLVSPPPVFAASAPRLLAMAHVHRLR